MYLRVLSLLGLFGSLSVGSYYSVVAPLFETSIDDDFYQDLNLLSRFDDKNIGYQGTIDNDDLGIRNYLFNNSLNLIWRKKDPTSNDRPITGNAFLLNLMIPDWMEDFHPDRKSYSPKSYISGDEVVLLLGASWSFVKKLFDKVNDWTEEVNNAETKHNQSTGSISGGLTMDQKSSNTTTHQLLMSHPWPTTSGGSYKKGQSYAYVLGDDAYSGFDRDVQKPYYFALEPKNVEAVYAAIDLSVNDELIKLNVGSRERMMYQLFRIHNHQDRKNIKWSTATRDIYGKEYHFAVDFAVLKVKFHVANLKGQFLDYLIGLYQKKQVIPQILNAHLDITNDRTQSMFIGGWEPMNEKEIDFHTMERLFVTPPEVSSDSSQASMQFTPKIYESYFSRSNGTPVESTNYEIVDQKWSQDVSGLAFLKYRIKNKAKQWVLPKYRELVVVKDLNKVKGDKDIAILQNWSKEKVMQDRKLIEFLEAKPKVHARWKEYGIKYSYFPFQNLQTKLWHKTALHASNRNDQPNQNTSLGIFETNGKHYLNLAHHLDIPNMFLNDGKGAVAIMQHNNRREKTMVGMYDGVSQWTNPISGQKRYVGKVSLFISPWRYDLFNYENNLSKPSLGDILKKKGLHSRLVQDNRFQTK